MLSTKSDTSDDSPVISTEISSASFRSESRISPGFSMSNRSPHPAVTKSATRGTHTPRRIMHEILIILSPFAGQKFTVALNTNTFGVGRL